MKTHELEKELGISKHTIFYYEKEGIVTPQRDANGYRSYNQDDLQKLIMIKFLRNLNISIDDVKAILNNELDFKECLEINQIHSIGIKKFVNLMVKKFNIIKGRCFGTVQFF